MTYNERADFVLGPIDVPDSALEMSATLLIDTIGVAAGAASMEAGRIARDHAVRFQAASDPSDAATLLFDGRKASITGASLRWRHKLTIWTGMTGTTQPRGILAVRLCLRSVRLPRGCQS